MFKYNFKFSPVKVGFWVLMGFLLDDYIVKLVLWLVREDLIVFFAWVVLIYGASFSVVWMLDYVYSYVCFKLEEKEKGYTQYKNLNKKKK